MILCTFDELSKKEQEIIEAMVDGYKGNIKDRDLDEGNLKKAGAPEVLGLVFSDPVLCGFGILEKDNDYWQYYWKMLQMCAEYFRIYLEHQDDYHTALCWPYHQTLPSIPNQWDGTN